MSDVWFVEKLNSDKTRVPYNSMERQLSWKIYVERILYCLHASSSDCTTCTFNFNIYIVIIKLMIIVSAHLMFIVRWYVFYLLYGTHLTCFVSIYVSCMVASLNKNKGVTRKAAFVIRLHKRIFIHVTTNILKKSIRELNCEIKNMIIAIQVI